MTGSEIVKIISKERTPDTPIVKWWCSEKDMIDFELVDTFVENVRSNDVFDGFSLLRMEDMWETLLSYAPDRIARKKQGQQEVIEWIWTDGEGREKRTVYAFTPQSLLSLMNDEFFS